MDDRNEKGQWLPGVTGNKSGRPQGGRSISLDLLDKICAEADTLTLFETALRERLQENPLSFYREFVVALAPKQLDIDLPCGEWANKTPAEIAEEMMKRTIGDIPKK